MHPSKLLIKIERFFSVDVFCQALRENIFKELKNQKIYIDKSKYEKLKIKKSELEINLDDEENSEVVKTE